MFDIEVSSLPRDRNQPCLPVIAIRGSQLNPHFASYVLRHQGRSCEVILTFFTLETLKFSYHWMPSSYP
jgi:hypothetical protein